MHRLLAWLEHKTYVDKVYAYYIHRYLGGCELNNVLWAGNCVMNINTKISFVVNRLLNCCYCL